MIKHTKIKDMNFSEYRNGFRANVTVNGKRKTFYGKTKNEIRQKYQEYLEDAENSIDVPMSNFSLNEYIEYWLVNFKLKTIEPSSYDKLERTYKNQIKNTLGTKPMTAITTQDIQDLINLYASPDSGEGLARSGLKKILQLLNQCYNNAIKENKIVDNPCNNVYIPKEMFIKAKTKEQFSLSDIELEMFKKACLKRTSKGNYKYFDGLYLLLLLNTGMRAGELLALNWSDINFKNKTIYINKIVQNKVVDRTQKDYKRVDRIKKGSKTLAGERFIPMNDNTVSYLYEIKRLHDFYEIKTDFVCATSVGTRQTHRNLLRSLKTVIKNYSDIIPQQTSLHTLRHSFGSKLIRSNVDISIVSKLLGHSNITVTYNKYIHVLQEETVKAMSLVAII